MLGYHRVDGGHAGNVNDCHPRIRLHNRFQQRFHHYLGTRAVEGANQWKSENSFPEFHHRGREFQHVFLLPANYLFPGFQVRLGRIQPKAVE